MMFVQFSLGIAPEALQAVDVHTASGEALAMIDLQVAVSTEGQCIVSAELVGIDERSALDHAHGLVEQRLAGDIGDDCNRHLALSLQNAEDGYFAGCAPSASPLAPTSEIGLVELDLRVQYLGLLLGEDGLPDQRKDPQGRRVTYPRVGCRLQRSDLQFEEFDQPQPCAQFEANQPKPGAGKQAESVSAAAAAVAAFGQTIDSAASTGVTKNAAVFVPLLAQVTKCSRVTF